MKALPPPPNQPHYCRRKKFESPQQAASNVPNADNPFSARGAIRRQSLRDKTGMTLARLEAEKEHSDLIRSWSKEDVSSTQFVRVPLSSLL